MFYFIIHQGSENDQAVAVQNGLQQNVLDDGSRFAMRIRLPAYRSITIGKHSCRDIRFVHPYSTRVARCHAVVTATSRSLLVQSLGRNGISIRKEPNGEMERLDYSETRSSAHTKEIIIDNLSIFVEQDGQAYPTEELIRGWFRRCWRTVLELMRRLRPRLPSAYYRWQMSRDYGGRDEE